MATFADRFKMLRQEKNISLDDLAIKLMTNKSTLSRFENNQREPKKDFIERAALFFNVSVDYLLGITDNPKIMTVTKRPGEEIPPELLEINQDFIAVVEDKLKEGKSPEEIKELMKKAFDIIDLMEGKKK